MKQITVTDENQKVIGIIQFDGKQIISDSSFLQELIDKDDDILPKELAKRFEMLPERYSYGSRMFFSNVEEV